MTHDGELEHDEPLRPAATTSEKPLQSWKEIASYLDRNERTARRWEKTAGLPVRRHHGGPRSTVYAYPSELNVWRAGHKPKAAEKQPQTFFWWRGVALALGALLGVVWFIKYGPILNPPNPLVEATGITAREILSGRYSEGGPSPDGRFFAFVDWDTGNLAIRNLETGEQQQLTDGASLEEPVEYAMWSAISPDGTRIAFDWFIPHEDRTELRVVGRDGSNPRTILGAEAGFYHETVSWSSDGKHIATIAWRGSGARAQILWIPVASGQQRVLTTLGNDKWPGKVYHSPNDRYLAYSHTSKKYPPNYDVFLVATDGSGETTALVEHPANEKVLGWIPGRDGVVFLSDRSGTWDVWLLEIAEGQPKGDPKRVYTNLGNVKPIGFTDDGSFFFEVYSHWINNYVATLDLQSGKLAGPMTQPLVGHNTALDWSPDGRYLAYSSVRAGPEGPGIFEGSLRIRDLQTDEARTVPCDLLRIFDVRWSPDGNTLLVSGLRKREVVDSRLRSSLFSVDPQTGATKALVDKPKESIIVGEWALDGSGFYFVLGDSVVLHDLESGGERRIYEDSDLTGFLALSPRGERLIVGTDDPENGASLTVIDVSSNAAEQLLKLAEPRAVRGHFDWSPDGRHVYYMKAEEKEATSLWRIDTQGGTRERLWQTKKRLRSPRIHPEGRKITFAEATHETAIWVMEGFIPGSMASK